MQWTKQGAATCNNSVNLVQLLLLLATLARPTHSSTLLGGKKKYKTKNTCDTLDIPFTVLPWGQYLFDLTLTVLFTHVGICQAHFCLRNAAFSALYLEISIYALVIYIVYSHTFFLGHTKTFSNQKDHRQSDSSSLSWFLFLPNTWQSLIFIHVLLISLSQHTQMGTQTRWHKKNCIIMFTTAFFITDQNYIQPKFHQQKDG